MKQYEKPIAKWVALESTNVILASAQMSDGGEGIQLTALQEFSWNA